MSRLITKYQLKRAKIENVRRLVRWACGDMLHGRPLDQARPWEVVKRALRVTEPPPFT